MTIETERQAGCTVFRLHGELTGGEDSPLVESVQAALSGRGSCAAIDLSDVPYVTSAGLADLVRLVAQANVEEQRVAMCQPSSFVQNVFQITRLDRFFEVHESVETALRSFEARRGGG